MKLAAVALLLLTGCTFETGAVDDVMGTSCGHYLVDTQTADPGCSRDEDPSDGCFFSTADACQPRTGPVFHGGDTVFFWCPIGGRDEHHDLLSFGCR